MIHTQIASTNISAHLTSQSIHDMLSHPNHGIPDYLLQIKSSLTPYLSRIVFSTTEPTLSANIVIAGAASVMLTLVLLHK